MTKINLLPWREEERKERRRQFVSMMILCVILTVMLMFMVNLSIGKKQSDQEARNAYLQSEIKVLDSQIAQIEKLERERADLEQRMQIIQNLQQSRPQIVHLFDEIPRLLPDGLYLIDVERKDISLTIKGRTESNPRVSSFMRNIENSEWLKSPVLGAIVADKKSSTPSSEFSLSVSQKLPESAMKSLEAEKAAKDKASAKPVKPNNTAAQNKGAK